MEKFNYELWQMIQMTEGESATPFTLVKKSDSLNDLFQEYTKCMVGESIYCITDAEGKMIVDGSQWIFESPDKGKTIYRRRFGSYSKKELYKNE